MKNLQEATERICELKGSLLVLDTVLISLIQAMPAEVRAAARLRFEANAEVARTVLLHASISEHTIGTVVGGGLSDFGDADGPRTARSYSTRWVSSPPMACSTSPTPSTTK